MSLRLKVKKGGNTVKEVVRAIWEGELCNCVSYHSSATMLRCESSEAKMTTRCPNSGCLIEGASLAHT